MPTARIGMDLRSRGANLHTISRELRNMDATKVKDLFKKHLEKAATPYPRLVRASVLAIPVKEGGKHTGLRARIAQTVELSSGTDTKGAYVSVWVNPFRMLPDYVTLPLYMEGVTTEKTRYRHDYSRWRHPVFGNREVWRAQPPHPYFYQAVTPLGRAAGAELDAALNDITRRING